MSLYYITATRKKANATVQEIEGYQVCTTKSDPGKYYSKSDFFASHYRDTNTYETYNSDTGKGDKCEKKELNRENYLQTVGNGTTSDNLLKLPNV